MKKMRTCPNCKAVCFGSGKCAACGASPKTQKYRNVKTKAVVLGRERTFDSRGEMARAKALEMLQRQGLLNGLALQPKFVLIGEATPKITYRPDFEYWENGVRYCEDFKSPATRQDGVFKLKLALWRWRGPCPLRLTMMERGGRLKLETIPKGTQPLTT